MKIILIAFIIVFSIGCKKTNVNKLDSQVIISSHKGTWDVYEWSYKGHIYLVINNYISSNNTSITHAGHCQCMSK